MLFSASCLRHSIAALDVRNLLDYWIVEETGSKNRTQDAMHVFVDLVLRDFSALDSFLECVAEEVLARLLLVEASVRGFGSGMCTTPIGDDEALKVEILFQDVGEQIFVFAGIVAIDAVVGAHECAGIGDLESYLEGKQIRFAHGTLVDVYVYGIAAALLVVHCIVLQVADYVLRLHSLDEVADQRACQKRVFALILKRTAVARLARQVDASAERHAVALLAQLAADQCAIFKGSLRIPCGSSRQVVGQRGGIASGGSAARDTVG